jgi:SNF2 family DNA or RNA helicase
MMIQPQSAGHGLNLQAGGHTLIWFSMPWSLEHYEQTNARLYRQGQTEPVVIHRLLTLDTVDRDIAHALEEKDCVQENLLKAVKAAIKI